jgi:hypothetical protein
MQMNLAAPAGTVDVFGFAHESIERALADFRSGLPATAAARLDLTPGSLDALGRWLVETYATPDALPAAALEGAAYYAGETFRRALGGRWQVQPGDSRSAYAGLPVIAGFDNKLGPLCPRALLVSAVERREAHHLGDLLRFRLRYGAAAPPASAPRRCCRVCEG